MVLLLLPRASIWLSLIANWCLMGDTLWGQPWTPTLRLPYKCYGRSGRRMTVLWTFHRPPMCRSVHRQLLRNELACFYHYRTRNCLSSKELCRDIQ